MIELNDPRITISRVSYNKGDDYISISVEERESCLEIIDIKISFEDFGKAITGLSMQPCKAKLNTNPNINKTREHKIEIVDFLKYPVYDINENQFSKCVKSIEVDGWKASYASFKNTRYTQVKDTQNSYYVNFERWI